MPLTILSSKDVRSLLLSLSRDDVQDLQRNLAEALREYSTGNQDAGCCSEYQPHPSVISKRNGRVTAFIPASTGDSVGFKIMTMSDAVIEGGRSGKSTQPISRRPLSMSFADDDPSQSTSSLSSATSQLSGITLGTAGDSATRQSRSHSPAHRTPKQMEYDTNITSPSGSLTLLDPSGAPFGLINAQELTAFRTALTSLTMFYRRQNVSTITVFGAGRQAYWHIRLALLLRGHEIKRVNIINRSFERATNLLREFYSVDHAEWRSNVKFSTFSQDFVEYDRLLYESVQKADVIFCCTSSPEPLFDAEFLTSAEAKRKGRYIAAIGSCRSSTAELHPDILRDVVNPQVLNKREPHGGVVIVDSIDSCLRDAGEVVRAELNPRQLVEVGELLMVKEATKKEGEEVDKGLIGWLQRGNVVFKSVGLGLTDLVVGEDIIKLARKRQVGTVITEF